MLPLAVDSGDLLIGLTAALAELQAEDATASDGGAQSELFHALTVRLEVCAPIAVRW